MNGRPNLLFAGLTVSSRAPCACGNPDRHAQEIVGPNIPTGVPLVYKVDAQLKPLKHYYLGDSEELPEQQLSLSRGRRDR
jgi:hypothetical protein